MQAAQPALLEPGDAGLFAFDRGADPLECGHDALPRVRHSGRVRRDEAQRRAAGQRLPQPQARMDAVGLGGGGRLADQRLAPDLRRQRERTGRERLPAAGGDGEFEAGKEDADDHRGTHVRIPVGNSQPATEGCHSPDARSSERR